MHFNHEYSPEGKSPEFLFREDVIYVFENIGSKTINTRIEDPSTNEVAYALIVRSKRDDRCLDVLLDQDDVSSRFLVYPSASDTEATAHVVSVDTENQEKLSEAVPDEQRNVVTEAFRVVNDEMRGRRYSKIASKLGNKIINLFSPREAA